MRKFRKLGFIDYNGELKINNSLLNVVLHDQFVTMATDPLPAAPLPRRTLRRKMKVERALTHSSSRDASPLGCLS